MCVYLTVLYLTEHLRMIQSPTAVCIQVCGFDGENDSSMQAGVQECVTEGVLECPCPRIPLSVPEYPWV